MKKTLSYIITFCLIAIVVLMLIRNKREINAEIEFAELKVAAYPVKVTEVTLGTLDTKLEVSGILSAAHDLMMMAETQGRIRSLYKTEGEWVKKGEAIAQVDDELMQAELMVTEANYEKAKKDLERAVALSDGGAITQQQLEGLQLNKKAAEAKYITSQKRVNDALIKAPISGYINQLFIKEGGMIGGGVPVCELVNIRSLKMSIKVDESEVGKITKGKEVDVRVESMNDRLLKGTVTSVGAKADYALQYEIELIIPENPEEILKAGMVATAIFNFIDQEIGLLIPEKALVGSTQDPKVYIVEEDVAHLKPISISYIVDNQIKVLDGLSESELVVIAGQFNLQDKQQVNIME